MKGQPHCIAVRSRSAARGTAVLSALWLVATPCFSLEAAPQPESGGARQFDVTVDQGLLSLEAREAALARVLRAVAEQADFKLRFRGEVDTPVTLSLDGVPLETGIRRLVGRNSLVIMHDSRDVSTVLVDVAYAAPIVAIEHDRPAFTLDRIYGDVTRPDRIGRLRTIRRLGKRGDMPALKDLGLVLSLEQDPMLRRMAVMGLGSAGRDEAVPALAFALGDRNASVRAQSLRALAKIEGAAAQVAVIEALGDEAAMVRAEAVRVLGLRGGEDAVEALRDVLLDETDPAIRRDAVAALAKLPGEEAAFALEIGAADLDPAVRETALAALEVRP